MRPVRPWLPALLVLLAGCNVPIAADLDEADANRIVVALEENGIAADKQTDTSSEGRWQVAVARHDASSAVRVLKSESLPAPSSPGVLDALGQGSIVPSRASEHAKLVAGTAGDLERSLRSVDGILSARVHLAVPTTDAWSLKDNPTEPTASVLLRHRAATSPIRPGDVKELVAGAVPGLSAERVSVVATPIPAASRSSPQPLAHFGPVTVTRSSMLMLRVLVGAAAALNVILIAIVLLLWMRVRRLRLARPEAHSLAEAAPHDTR